MKPNAFVEHCVFAKQKHRQHKSVHIRYAWIYIFINSVTTHEYLHRRCACLLKENPDVVHRWRCAHVSRCTYTHTNLASTCTSVHRRPRCVVVQVRGLGVQLCQPDGLVPFNRTTLICSIYIITENFEVFTNTHGERRQNMCSWQTAAVWAEVRIGSSGHLHLFWKEKKTFQWWSIFLQLHSTSLENVTPFSASLSFSLWVERSLDMTLSLLQRQSLEVQFSKTSCHKIKSCFSLNGSI